MGAFFGGAFFGGAFLGAFVCGAPFLEAAPGYRERAGGGLSYVGKGGYNWASTVSDTNGMHLNFNVTWFGPSNADSHAYGFQLRCLSE